MDEVKIDDDEDTEDGLSAKALLAMSKSRLAAATSSPREEPEGADDVTEEEEVEQDLKNAEDAVEEDHDDEEEEEKQKDLLDVGAAEEEEEAGARPNPRPENSELWALLNYSKQRIETGAHAPGTPPPPRARRRTSPKSATGAPDLPAEEGISAGSSSGNAEGANQEGAAAASEKGRPDYDDLDDSDYVPSESESCSESYYDDSDFDDENAVPSTPAFLRKLEDSESNPTALPDPVLNDAARSYADAILRASDEKQPGNLTDEQMLEAIYVAEEAAKNGESSFATFGNMARLHEAKAKMRDLRESMNVDMGKAAMRDLRESMKVEMDKAAISAREVRQETERRIGVRGMWFKNKVKNFQETCRNIDNAPPRQAKPQS